MFPGPAAPESSSFTIESHMSHSSVQNMHCCTGGQHTCVHLLRELMSIKLEILFSHFPPSSHSSMPCQNEILKQNYHLLSLLLTIFQYFWLPLRGIEAFNIPLEVILRMHRISLLAFIKKSIIWVYFPYPYFSLSIFLTSNIWLEYF
jgi:hypothetical protein